MPGDVFHAVAENAVQVYGNGRNAEELLNELCANEDLAKVSSSAMRFSCLALMFCVSYQLKQLMVKKLLPFWGERG